MFLKKKYISTKVTVFAAILYAHILPCLAQEINQPDLKHKLDEYMSRAASQGFSGVLLVARDKDVMFSKGYGSANRLQNIPVLIK